MRIGGTHDGGLEQTVVLVHAHQGFHDEDDKAQIVLGSLACSMEQHTSIGTETPVVVLARAVDTGKWLFMQQYSEAVLVSHTLHQAHQQHVVVDSEVALLVDRSQLKLVWRHFVMACLAGNTQFESLDFKVFHERLHTLRNGAEVMVVHLLVFG